ncbi:hypothetical protein CC85DRAFT_298528 [Cutaneotrichosporon oleaginosum]|uniref:Uncharacterized protein n=1 Tax=Cutaneotrichosporon oleaginosum TaxID=879819 RepID=A0A0J1BE31_9TREE|nr:uncharacterized protein CC85DRAFT_298528 [Cutaneotrichosporon oleaginosum]KLT46324.1 hypothetical protein CC85DRAFT_298528 [Cutaneotrichosporon oleaginosum]TXT15304.1 hypothetical protein COLE_01497 [Cutaneotrichosporon oleaginosum]
MRLLIAALIAAAAPVIAVPLDSVFVHARYLASLGLEARQNLAASPYGICNGHCKVVGPLDLACGDVSRSTRRSLAACRTACDDGSRAQVSECLTCIHEDGSNSTQAGRTSVLEWAEFMDTTCPLIRDTTTTPPSTRPCSQCDALYPRVMMACNSSNPETCRGLCGDLGLINECIECYRPYGFEEYASYGRDAQWYCTTEGGQACSRMIGDVNRLCDDGQSSCKDICTGSHWEDIKQCERAVPSSGLTGTQGPTILDGIGSFNQYCEQPPKPNKTGCATECDTIRATYGDLCRDKQATKCRGMCTPENLGAFEACNTCAQGGNSTYTEDTKLSISASWASLGTWCRQVETKPIDDPEVIGTIPDPKPVEVVETEPTETDTTKDPGPLKNPFANSETSNTGSPLKGIPTWGIGVAAGGGALLIAAVVGSVIACNYECDPDHRRLRRRRKKNKKNDEEKPQQQQQQQQQQDPQIVGFMVPSERPPSQGYFAGASSPPLSTPLSAPVSMAHTPVGPGPMSPPQSPPGSPPPTGAYPQQQYGQFPQQQYGQQYAPYPPYQGGQQY